MADKDCKGCAYCSLEPDDMNFVCNHPDNGPSRPFGIYLHLGIPGHCGTELKNFKQHPGRTPEGGLKLNG